MYSTCLFCHAQLGRNEAIEHFQVGRRLAYDGARGRLWVVCRGCERWNLTPLEERWEAVEECERAFSTTRQRVSTAQIGLARLPDGTELVRIGRPLRPELAAWRYGDQFGRRRRRRLALAGAALAVGGGALTWGATAGVGLLTLWQVGRPIYRIAVHGWPNATVAYLRGPRGQLLQVDRAHLSRSAVVRDERGALAVSVTHRRGTARLSGADALRGIGQLMPATNRFGGTREEVARAVARLEHAGSGERYVASLASTSALASRRRMPREADDEADAHEAGLFALPLSVRLALEMAAHEEQERRALEGELADLERAWRDAEEIAAIADDLLLPAPVQQAWDRLRGRQR